jgi:hypothetical protein
MKRLISFANLVLFATFNTSANAAITVYTSQAAFLSAISTAETDTFLGLSTTSSTSSPIARTTGTYTYTATTSAQDSEGVFGFYAGGTSTDPFLAPSYAFNTITFSNFGGGVSALAGNFFASNSRNRYQGGEIMVSVVDQSGVFSKTISPASMSSGSFLGFVTTETMVSLRISTVPSFTAPLWASVDNLILASANQAVLTPSIPEPENYALMLTSLGVLVSTSKIKMVRQRLASR